MKFYLRYLSGVFMVMAWCISAHAITVSIPEEVGQGEPFWVEISSEQKPLNIAIDWMDKLVDYPVDLPGKQRALLGAGLDHKGKYPLEVIIDLPQGPVNKSLYVNIVEKDYPVQRLTLPESMVTPPQEVIDRIIYELEKTTTALNTLNNDRYWSGEFIRPVPGSVSSPFGVRRFLNDQPRSPHRGVDFRGPEGTPVKAMESGKVILAGDLYYGGQTVIVDHGLGLQTVYMHLSKTLTSEGEYISRGDLVGLVGMTGRSTGPHLHLGVYILGEAVDPMYLLGE
jgi:murein DD-endopeptidase MepM/ murein hydrolase activator NlpD